MSEGMLFTLPKRICPVHGEVNQLLTIRIPGIAEREHCLICYAEWIDKNIPRVTNPPLERGGC